MFRIVNTLLVRVDLDFPCQKTRATGFKDRLWEIDIVKVIGVVFRFSLC